MSGEVVSEKSRLIVRNVCLPWRATFAPVVVSFPRCPAACAEVELPAACVATRDLPVGYPAVAAQDRVQDANHRFRQSAYVPAPASTTQQMTIHTNVWAVWCSV